MDRPPLNPAFLPPGTRVGAWKVVDLRGRGSFGAVYLVEGVEPPASGFAALKLALAPHDARFAREVGLLSRLSHPCVPRLLEAGEWQHPNGPAHPFLVMEWVEGLPLYVWAQARRPTSRQVLRLLTGLARALEATHAAKAVHRDVKGGNVLVRLADDRAFLVDFGSASYAGVTPLTWTVFPPDTPAYRSPEAYRHAQLQGEARPYAHKPADDVFALGITAYRLVTGEYPPSREPLDVEAYRWQVDGPRPASALNPCCAPVLSALISRMLSIQSEARGSAGELAEALEQAAREAGDAVDAPLFGRAVVPKPEPELKQVSVRYERPAAPRAWLALAGVAAVLAGVLLRPWLGGMGLEHEEGRDAGSVAVGDSVQEAPRVSLQPPSTWSPIAVDLPSKPLPGQSRPDTNGRCPQDNQVPIHGGCWWKLEVAAKDCKPGNYVYKGKCYAPAVPLPPPSTSNPVERPDGG